MAEAVVAFNRGIIEATADLVCAYKPNSAYYEALGERGHWVLVQTIAAVRELAPTVPVLLDAKRADIGETSAAYATAVFDDLGADAVTVHPYFGGAALAPFLERADRGVIVMGANSHPGAGELQDVLVGPEQEPLYRYLSRVVARDWNRHGNCGLTAGATQPEKIRQIREVAPTLPLLILGIGAQGGDLDSTVGAGMDANGAGMIISTSRAISYASAGEDFREAARAVAESFSARIAVARDTAMAERQADDPRT